MLKISPTCWTKTDTCALLFLENYTAGSKRPIRMHKHGTRKAVYDIQRKYNVS